MNKQLLDLQNAIHQVARTSSSERNNDYLRLGWSSSAGLVCVRFNADQTIKIDVDTANAGSRPSKDADKAIAVAVSLGWK